MYYCDLFRCREFYTPWRGVLEGKSSGINNNLFIRIKQIQCMEPRFTDTRLIRTPRYYGQFRWSRRKPHAFSLKLTRLIRTPVNTDDGHFSVSQVTNPYTLSTPLYGHCLSVHGQFSLSRLFANLKTLDPGQIMTEFDELKRFHYKE